MEPLSSAYDTLLTDLVGGLSIVLLSVAGVVLIVWDAFKNNDRRLPWVAAVALGLAAIWECTQVATASTTAFYGLIYVGGIASFVNVVVLLSALATVLFCIPYLRAIQHGYGEVYALLLFATVGMIALATSNNMVTIFVGLETMSIALYVLTGLVREHEGAIESALKYFLLGAFATGFLLYGIALLYAASGTMYLPEMAAALRDGGVTPLASAGVGMLLIGFFFKVSVIPFHMWAPDVYQGAPTPLSGFMSTASKAAAFAALILVLYHGLGTQTDWQQVMAIVALVTMVGGNLVALVQTNVKRLLAYSSIAHAGYILVALAAGTSEAYAGAIYYLVVYALMNIGAFGVIAFLEWDGKEGSEQTLDALSGVGMKMPFLGVVMAVFMFSLTGFPPFGGFWGKVALFGPAVDAGLTWLVIVGVLTSVLSGYYYLRVLFVIWMRDPVEQRTAQMIPSTAAVLAVCAVALLVVGFVPYVRDLTLGFFL